MLFCFAGAAPVVSGVSFDEGGDFQAAADNFVESSTPLVQAVSRPPETRERRKRKRRKRRDAFSRKLGEAREKFSEEERRRKKKFLAKLRSENMSDGERQEKIAKFNAKELERRREFAEKQNREARTKGKGEHEKSWTKLF